MFTQAFDVQVKSLRSQHILLVFFFFFLSIFFECRLTYAHPHGMNCSVYGDIVLVTKVVLVNESRTAFLLTLLWL
jgi:hypothetical protein